MQRKRFIAGAVCPQCQAQDTLAVGREDDVDVVECVQCGYHQRQSDTPATEAAPYGDTLIARFHPD